MGFALGGRGEGGDGILTILERSEVAQSASIQWSERLSRSCQLSGHYEYAFLSIASIQLNRFLISQKQSIK